MDIFAELETSGLPAFRQGSMLPDEPYPDQFWTAWEMPGEEIFYDNRVIYTIRAFSVCFYSNDPASARGKVQAMREYLRGRGFKCSPPEDTQSDELTHIGYGFDAIFQENNSKGE